MTHMIDFLIFTIPNPPPAVPWRRRGEMSEMTETEPKSPYGGSTGVGGASPGAVTSPALGGERMEKKRILLGSRHDPIPAELDELKRLLGDYMIVQYTSLVEIRENEEESDLIRQIKSFKPHIVIPVLPLSVIKLLVDLKDKYGYEVWEATFETVRISENDKHNAYDEVVVKLQNGKWKIMKFVSFSRIKKVEIEREPVA
jgi:hypothetical protein